MRTLSPRTKPPTVLAARPSRQPREFVPHALHKDWLVATFGRTTVTIKPAPDRTIYRGEETDADGARIPAGVWPGFGYIVEIEGEMTGKVATLDAAKAMGEWRALNSQTNHRRVYGALLYSLTPGRAAESMAMLDADRDALMAAYPFTPENLKSMARSHPGYEKIEANSRAREIDRLTGYISPFD